MMGYGELPVTPARRRTTQMQQRSNLALGFGPMGDSRALSVDFTLKTAHASELIDITDRVEAIVTEADLDTGMALVSSPHTTCAVIVNEAEEGFARDFARALDALAPVGARYEHNDAPHDEE